MRYTIVKNHMVAPTYDNEPSTESVETCDFPHVDRCINVTKKTNTCAMAAISSRRKPTGDAHSIRLRVHAIQVNGERRANKTIDAVLATFDFKFVVEIRPIKAAVRNRA